MKLAKFEFLKSDGRKWIQYHSEGHPTPRMIDEGLVRPQDWQAPEMRFNVMRDEWVAVSSSRNNRPFLPPAEYCPLCPMDAYLTDPSGALCKTDAPIMSHRYQWAAFENMFPGLAAPGGSGHCEVILYSPKHSGALSQCDTAHIEGLIEVWKDRSRTVGALPHVKHVFIFENKGTEVGVTLHHPHGQLYGFNHHPPFLAREMEAATEYFKKTRRCLICDIAAREAAGPRLVAKTDHLVAFVPEAARYPYEVHITTLGHRPLIEDLTQEETSELASLLKVVMVKYNQVLNMEFPYIMVHHQCGHDEPGALHYHWHIEFYPPYRAAGKLKYLAGVESGTGLFINDTIPERKAKELRALPGTL